MVKVFAPMMSLDASGTLGDAVTFSKWKGRNYVRERVIPSNPKSGAQVGRRAMFKFLSQHWTDCDTAEKATWQDIADAIVASPFNAFLKDNMEYWHNFLTPTQDAARSLVGNGSDNAITSAAWEENRVKLVIDGTGLAQSWGIAIFAKLAGAVTPAVGNCVIIEVDSTVATHAFYWTPPSLGRWYFDSITFSVTGSQEAAGGGVDTGA